MPREEHFRKLERMYRGAPINDFYPPEVEISEGAAEVRLEAEPRFHHAAGTVHGSVYFKMLDDAAFFAAQSVVEDAFVVTATFNIYLLRPIATGTMVARGRVTNNSRRLIVADAELVDSDGRQLARGSGTFMRTEMTLKEEMGYRAVD